MCNMYTFCCFVRLISIFSIISYYLDFSSLCSFLLIFFLLRSQFYLAHHITITLSPLIINRRGLPGFQVQQTVVLLCNRHWWKALPNPFSHRYEIIAVQCGSYFASVISVVNKRNFPQVDARLSKCISKLKLRRKRLAQPEVSSLQADKISTIPASVSGAQTAGVTVLTFQVRLPVLCVFTDFFFRNETFPMQIIIQVGRMSFTPFSSEVFSGFIQYIFSLRPLISNLRRPQLSHA